MTRQRALRLAGLAALAAVTGLLLAQVLRAPGQVTTGASDWIPLAAASRLVLAGHGSSLYVLPSIVHAEGALLGDPGYSTVQQPFLDPPVAALVVAPLAVLPPSLGEGLWAALSLLALGGAALLLIHLGAPRLTSALACFSVAAGFGLLIGQWDALFLAALVASLATLERRPLVAGLLLSVLLLKPQTCWLAVPVLLLSARWRALAGFAIGATAGAGLSVLAAGPGCLGSLLTSTLSVAHTQLVWTTGLPGLLAFYGAPPSTELPATLGGLAVLLPIALRERDRISRHLPAAIALSVVASVLLSPHAFTPDLTLAAPAIALGARRLPRAGVAVALALSVPFLGDLAYYGSTHMPEAFVCLLAAGGLGAGALRGGAPAAAALPLPRMSGAAPGS